MVHFDKLGSFNIILASRSPRRQQLLRELGLKFDVIIKDYKETFPEGLGGEEIARYVAHEKAISFNSGISDNDIVIAADTIVWCNGKVLSKPIDSQDAVRILKEISGNTHEVITGVSLYSIAKEKVFSVSTKVTFETFSCEEIYYYVDKYKPFDKAGAYGIQEHGEMIVNSVAGSLNNIIGLPTEKLAKSLELIRRLF